MKTLKGHKGTLLFLFIFFLAGAIGLSLSFSRPLFLLLVPWSLLLGYIIIAFYHRSAQIPRVIASFALIAVAGYFMEVLGVITGHIFGHYIYGQTLGLKVMDVPLLIGMNWAMLAYCVYLITSQLKIPVFFAVLFGAMLMTAYDFLMEPTAVTLQMWSWDAGIIPLQNYLAWFALSVIFLSFLYAMKLKYRNIIALPTFIMQAGFFGIQQLFSHFNLLL